MEWERKQKIKNIEKYNFELRANLPRFIYFYQQLPKSIVKNMKLENVERKIRKC